MDSGWKDKPLARMVSGSLRNCLDSVSFSSDGLFLTRKVYQAIAIHLQIAHILEKLWSLIIIKTHIQFSI